MMSISLGPLALPAAPLLLAACGWVAVRVAARLGGKAHGVAASDTVFHALMLALLAARAVHVGVEFDLYRAALPSIIDIRDGGWHAPAGWAAGVGWLLWRGARSPPLRRALATAAVGGAAAWFGVGALIGLDEPVALPELELLTLDGGQPTTLKAFAAGRPLVVNLWASWCGPCRVEMPMLAAAQRREAGVAIVFVNQGEAADVVRRYAEGVGLDPRAVLLDPPARLGPAVGSGGLPTTLFYDAAGRPFDAHFGVLSEAALGSRLRRLRAAP